jgi:hypothetical protein
VEDISPERTVSVEPSTTQANAHPTQMAKIEPKRFIAHLCLLFVS